jgi:hypothetical protein
LKRNSDPLDGEKGACRKMKKEEEKNYYPRTQEKKKRENRPDKRTNRK